MNSTWANEDRVGVIVTVGGFLTYLDSGPDYEAAVAAGPAPYAGPSDAVDPTAPSVDWRATAKCSPMQGKLALGETEWAKIENYRDTQATWAQRIVIDSAQEWRRNSQDIQFFGYLLGYDENQLDDLFKTAMQIEA